MNHMAFNPILIQHSSTVNHPVNKLDPTLTWRLLYIISHMLLGESWVFITLHRVATAALRKAGTPGYLLAALLRDARGQTIVLVIHFIS